MILSMSLIAILVLALHLPAFLFLWSRYRKLLAFHQLVLGAALGACAQLVLTLYALSLIRSLVPATWLALNLAAASGLAAAAWRRGLALAELRSALAERLALARQLPRRPAVLAVVALSALGLAWLVAKAWVYPVYDWDGANAHLALARQMLQERGVTTQLAPVPRITFATFVPHVFFAATLNLPSGYEWVNGTNIYFLLLAMLAQYGFVRRLGLTRSSALLVSPAVLFCPVLFQQATTDYVDLTAAAFVGAVLPFIPSRRESALVELSLVSVALGLAVGSKESMLLLLPLMGAGLLGWTWWVRGSGTARQRLLAPIAIMVVSVVLLGGYRYISNTVRVGNPVFPSAVDLPGIHLPGRFNEAIWSWGALYGHPVDAVYKLASPLRQIWISWREENHYTIRFPYCEGNALGGFGPVWFVLFLPAIAISLAFARRGPWLLALAIFGLYLAIMPEARSLVRYVAFIFFLGPAAYALVGSRLSRGGRATWQALLLCGLILSFLMNVSFCEDGTNGLWLRTLLSQDRSAQCAEANPAVEFLREVPAPRQTVAVAGTSGAVKNFFCWNEAGTNRVRWLVDPDWFEARPVPKRKARELTSQDFLGVYPDPPRGEALWRALDDDSIDFVLLSPGIAKEVAHHPGYRLVIPASPPAGAFMTCDSPASIWMRVKRR